VITLLIPYLKKYTRHTTINIVVNALHTKIGMWELNQQKKNFLKYYKFAIIINLISKMFL